MEENMRLTKMKIKESSVLNWTFLIMYCFPLDKKSSEIQDGGSKMAATKTVDS